MTIKKNTFISVKCLIKPSFMMALITLNLLLPVSSKVYFLEADFYQDKTRNKKIILGKGEVILSDKAISRVAVSDPSIVDVQILNEKEIFSRAKQLGTSTVLIWEKDNDKPSRFDVSVWPDVDLLTTQLQELDENITVEYVPPSSTLTSNSQGEEASSDPSAASQPSLGGQSATTSSSNSNVVVGKIILKGEVLNAEVIARALQVAGAYVGDQGVKIISQPGGQIVDGLAGKYDIYSNSDYQANQNAQGSATAFGARDPLRFTSNRYANLSRGVIATTQKGSVISFLTVKDSAQISVAIRFYEISRTAARNLGFNATLGGNSLQGGTFVGGNGISQAIGGIGSIGKLSSFMASTGQTPADFQFGPNSSPGGSFLAQTLGDGVTGVIFNPTNGIGAVIQALQQRGEVKTLAEPNLVIANGEPASFLAGGEVPILRAVFTAGGASQDVSYEPFGIKFSLMPTLIGENKIFLQLIPEIRDIDTELSNLVVPPGSTSIRPPAFRTRRTQTQVELFSGQAFAISGLLREDNTRNLRKVPGIGDIPVLGTLFRSKSFSKGQSELLIVVSPVIIKPTDPDKIAKIKVTPDVPYDEFNQMPPLKHHIDMMDEQGPSDKEPIDAGKYNNPPSSDDKSFNKNVSDKSKEISESKKEENHVKQIVLEEKLLESKAEESKSLTNSDNSKWLELQKRAKDEFENQKKVSGSLEKEITPSEFNEDNKVKQNRHFFMRNKKELSNEDERKLKEERKREKLTKKIEEERKKQIELLKHQESLKETWQQEMQRYVQAKEAMKQAREQSSN